MVIVNLWSATESDIWKKGGKDGKIYLQEGKLTWSTRLDGCGDIVEEQRAWIT